MRLIGGTFHVSLPTLEGIEYYNRGGNPNPQLDSEIHPLRLTTEEQRALVTFLKLLSTIAKAGEH